MTEKIRVYYEQYPAGSWRAWAIVYGQRVEMFGETKDLARSKLIGKSTYILRQNATEIEDIEIDLNPVKP